ncbi:hypothetical protein AA106555_1412 [Neokomagataea thailandica NBRC 106555]|uniref:MAPEG family protein n=2 Tax=Neokomagataea TaxID=1223423 RepID=A0A4Y6V8B9_9PROT|nr:MULTISPECIES: MAPEG family protein [Neokomagataea]QDH24727.1 hypothetical protein D5366_05215 [Neokomagataea tanensis]GBR53733.1 hypothetical protein AA106555_1412 [Neokomagataea thailandica NBRC 106555]
MKVEVGVIAGVILLALVNIFWASIARTKQYGTQWNVGARDGDTPPLNPFPARLKRAQENLFETLPLFLGAILTALAVNHTGWKTQWGGILYLGARVAYLPIYAAGIPVIRTLIFFVSLIGLLLVLFGAVFS